MARNITRGSESVQNVLATHVRPTEQLRGSKVFFLFYFFARVFF